MVAQENGGTFRRNASSTGSDYFWHSMMFSGNVPEHSPRSLDFYKPEENKGSIWARVEMPSDEAE